MKQSAVFIPDKVRRKSFDFFFPAKYFRKRVHDMPCIPAYFFHQVERGDFEAICARVSAAGYRTVTSFDLVGGGGNSKRSLWITFDDGFASVWSVVFPIAKKYGVRFTLFINPLFIEDSTECRSGIGDGLEHARAGQRDQGPQGMLTWGEVRALHESGLVDIQSHSLSHGVVFVSDRLLTCQSSAGPIPLSGHTPLIERRDGKDVIALRPAEGTPIYELGPALACDRRFFGDSVTRERCVELVREHGGLEVFAGTGWEEALLRMASTSGDANLWESDAERAARFRTELSAAKEAIELRLPNSRVHAVALPWGAMHRDIPKAARDTGHELCVLAYPFPSPQAEKTVLPLYPRLLGDGIWILLYGPILGTFRAMRARLRSKKRRKSGTVP